MVAIPARVLEQQPRRLKIRLQRLHPRRGLLLPLLLQQPLPILQQLLVGSQLDARLAQLLALFLLSGLARLQLFAPGSQ